MPGTSPLQKRLATLLQMALGGLLLTIAVSTDFDFTNAQMVEIHILENVTARFWLPAIAALAIKAVLAFLGSYLLMHRSLILKDD